MSLDVWLAFAAASGLLLMMPGPTVLLVLSYALGRGWMVAGPMAIGVALGDLTAMTLSLLGVGAILATSADLFIVLRWTGAAYLVWLGISLWRAGNAARAEARTDGVSPLGMLGHAWLVTTLNPKSIIFFVAFLPQFLNPLRPFATQAVILVATFVGLAFLNALGVAALGARARRLVASPTVMRWIHRTGGTGHIGAGLATAATARQGV
jgi:threonine/homoserine/homoserine lactone efflux protein